MDRIGFVDFKGKPILRIDFSHLGTREALVAIAEAERVIASQPLGSTLTLTDVTDGNYNAQITKALKDYTAHNKPYVKAAAVVGATGLRKILVTTMATFTGRDIKAFDTIEEALEWLSKF
jgi:hypothetical protein